MLMDNSVAREANGEVDRDDLGAERLPDSFESQNDNNESLEANAVDARANNNAETQRMRGELQEMFAQREETASKIEEVGEKEEAPAMPELDKLRSIDVPKDAKTIPSAFANEAQSIVDKKLKEGDVAGATDALSKIRWEYMEKAFSRKLGDGLNGTGA